MAWPQIVVREAGFQMILSTWGVSLPASLFRVLKERPLLQTLSQNLLTGNLIYRRSFADNFLQITQSVLEHLERAMCKYFHFCLKRLRQVTSRKGQRRWIVRMLGVEVASNTIFYTKFYDFYTGEINTIAIHLPNFEYMRGCGRLHRRSVGWYSKGLSIYLTSLDFTPFIINMMAI